MLQITARPYYIIKLRLCTRGEHDHLLDLIGNVISHDLVEADVTQQFALVKSYSEKNRSRK